MPALVKPGKLKLPDGAGTTPAPENPDSLLLESGDFILLETGDKILLG